MQKPVRVAFAGCMASGKSFAAQHLKKRLPFAKILSLATAVKNMVRGNPMFDNRQGYQLVGSVGRQIDPEAWVKILSNEIAEMDIRHSIIVDDVRFENELIALRNLGFTIIYMDTPWHLRLQRVRDRLAAKNRNPSFIEFVGWFTHESETQLGRLPKNIFDKVFVEPEEMIKYIDNTY